MGGSGDSLNEAWANTCVSLKKLTDEGYYGGGSYYIWIQHYSLSHCQAIEMLRDAKPPRISFLRDFRFDVETVDYLPAMMNLPPSCNSLCRQVTANIRGIPLSRFEEVLLRQVISETELDVWTAGWYVRLTVLARADFNADGLDDMLMLSSGGATEGTYAAAELFTVSRDGSISVLRIIDIEQHLCPEYLCRDSYEDPKVLRDSSEGNLD